MKKKIISLLLVTVISGSLISSVSASDANFSFEMVNALDGITQKTGLVSKYDDENRAYVKVKKDDICTKDLFYVSVLDAASRKVTNDK